MSEAREQERRQRVLTALGSRFDYTADQVVAQLVTTAVAGVTRPGSWEREVVERIFGREAVRVAAFELGRDE